MGFERTFAMIKPDATGVPWFENFTVKVPPPEPVEGEETPEDAKPPADEWAVARDMRLSNKSEAILARIEKAGFKIVQRKVIHLSKAEAEAFYVEHAGRPFYDTLTSFMSSGAVTALVLEKENAIKSWRDLMGPTNSLKAKAEAEAAHPLNEELWSLRALFGTDGTRNATHGSDSQFSAWREIGFFFPDHAALERSIAVVLPSAISRSNDVVAMLESHDFHVIGRKKVKSLSQEHAEILLGVGKSVHYASETAVKAAQSGEAEALLVEKVGAVRELRLLAGPQPSVGRSNTLHAIFGTDDDNLGVAVAHTSKSGGKLIAEIFTEPLVNEKTLCVIKPGNEHLAQKIADEIRSVGFIILAETKRQLTRDEVEEFYGEHKGKGFFDGLCSYMSSGPVVAFALAKPNAIRCWRMLMGPTNTFTAKRDKPSCLRAKYGLDGTRNATHGSDSPASAARELRFYFPDLVLNDHVPKGDAAIGYIKTLKVTEIFDPSKGFAVPRTLDAVLVDALAALARAKPSSDPAEAIRWLGNWLVNNNPRHGVASVSTKVTVVEADDDSATSGFIPHAVEAGGKTVATSAPSAPKRSLVFVLGAPGSGKGTQCARISKTFGYTHLSTGDLLRDEVKSGSALGKEVDAVISAGALVSTDLVLRLLQAAMDRDGGSRFLIDGFPRALDQAFAFEKAVGKPSFVLSFDAREHVLEERLVERGKTSGRADDNVESIRKRFATFKSQSEAVIDLYAKLGLVSQINSERSPDSVFEIVQELFKPQCVWVIGGPGAGRSTQCKKIVAANLGYAHLSTGDLMRAEVSKKSPLGVEIKAIMDRGDNVPTSVTMQLLKDAMSSNPSGKYLLDGFPKNVEQAVAYEKEFGSPKFVLSLTAPDSVLLERASHSGLHAAVIKKQLQSHHAESGPVLDLYSKVALLHSVDAARNADAVFEDVKRFFAPTIVFVLGGPGSGKGTQCANIVKDFSFVHLSAGDLLRAEVQRGSPNGTMINNYIAEGKIVPIEVTLDLIRTAMHSSRSSRFLIDGFPRAMDQAIDFEKQVGEGNFVLFFDCPEETMRERLLNRGKTSGRVDDNEAAIVKRFKTFVKDSMPVINHYASLGKVRTVNSTASIENVYSSVRSIFAPTVVFVLGLPGSGKGTQCANIVKEFGFVHLSTGDLLRAEVARGSSQGAELQALMDDGKLVPDETIMALLRNAMRSSGGSKFLIDGFPRAMNQAAMLEDELGARPNFVLHFDVPKDVVKKRMLARGKATGRSDDNEAAIDKRFATFDEQSAPVIKHYSNLSLVRKINGLVEPIDVFDQVKPYFQPQLVVVLGTVGSGRSELAVRAGRELNYHQLQVTKLLDAEVASGSATGKVIEACLASKRTVPIDSVIEVIRRAMARSPSSRFLLDGYPRLTSGGFPGVHDQVFALESRVGAIKGAIHLDCDYDMRVARTGAKLPGEIQQLRDRIDTFRREKVPVFNFFEKLGRAFTVNTTKKTSDEVFEAVRPFLE